MQHKSAIQSRSAAIWAALVACLVFTGCVTTLTELEMRQVALRTSREQNRGTIYYVGRTNSFDYYRIQWPKRGSNYRIPVPNSVTRQAKPYSKTRTDWIVCGPHDPNNNWLP